MGTRPSSTGKRAGRLASAGAILDAARTLFLRSGYLGTSMDEIAALAGVSKQTVYTHFADKQALFVALIDGSTEHAEQFLRVVAAVPDDAKDVERVLRELARRYVASVIQPGVVQLRRLVIGEASRFPELARAYYERIPERVIAVLAERLGTLAARGRLHVDDPELAARHFAWLVLAIPLDRALFYGLDGGADPAELERLAGAGVTVFLAAYGPRPR